MGNEKKEKGKTGIDLSDTEECTEVKEWMTARPARHVPDPTGQRWPRPSRDPLGRRCYAGDMRNPGGHNSIGVDRRVECWVVVGLQERNHASPPFVCVVVLELVVTFDLDPLRGGAGEPGPGSDPEGGPSSCKQVFNRLGGFWERDAR